MVLASSMMQLAGGIDWLVTVAAKLIQARPNQTTLIAPLVAFLFSVGAGSSNILYPLLPVISDLSCRNGIRPSRPLSLSVVATGITAPECGHETSTSTEEIASSGARSARSA